MKEKIKRIINTNQFHICMLVIIIVAIIFIAGVITLIYNVEGEMNAPFVLSKVSIISNTEGIDNQDAQNKWNLTVNQNNDIYLYIKKNDNYKQTETIKNIVIENFNIEEKNKIGELKLYKPDMNVETRIFKNVQENETDKIEYTGDVDSSIKNLKVSNQGGLIVFRYATTNIGNYISNEDEQINHDELLKKLNINFEDLKFKVSFDILINLDSGKSYKANMKLDLPVGNVVNNGMQSTEDIDINNIIFKRL